MITEGQHIGVQAWWSGRWHGPAVFVVRDGLLRLAPEFDRTSPIDIEIPGTLFARLTDHHVHLGLSNPEEILDGGITTVIDLGWQLQQASAWHVASSFPGSTLPEVRIAGSFLSCVGGYPSATDWAPADSTIELSTPDDVVEAVNAQLAAGASVIKVMLNSDAGPVPSDAILEFVVTAAKGHGVPVVAHVQGVGQAERALVAGVSAFAHAPFSESLDHTLMQKMIVVGLAWVSTLDIHGWGRPTPERAIAIDNVRRFAELGGRVLYGTDLGNGQLPNGINERELLALADAGLSADAIVASIAGNWQQAPVGPRFAWVEGVPPRDAHDLARWLAGARGTTIDYLEETLP